MGGFPFFVLGTDEKARYLYRHIPTNKWILSYDAGMSSQTSTPPTGYMQVATDDGTLPIGSSTWQIVKKHELVDHTLTVTLQ